MFLRVGARTSNVSANFFCLSVCLGRADSAKFTTDSFFLTIGVGSEPSDSSSESLKSSSRGSARASLDPLPFANGVAAFLLLMASSFFLSLAEELSDSSSEKSSSRGKSRESLLSLLDLKAGVPCPRRCLRPPPPINPFGLVKSSSSSASIISLVILARFRRAASSSLVRPNPDIVDSSIVVLPPPEESRFGESNIKFMVAVLISNSRFDSCRVLKWPRIFDNDPNPPSSSSSPGVSKSITLRDVCFDPIFR